tara:strand:+ start:3904 stop:4089 length:186 start_codon:yes stop_codon:yes gene_type:complete
MTLYFRLNKPIIPQKMLEDISNEIKSKEPGPDDVLVIEIKKCVKVVEDITREEIKKLASTK